MTLIRHAREDDIPWLLEQLRAFDRFFGAKHSLFPKQEYGQAFLAQRIAEGAFFVASRDDNGITGYRVGFIAGTVSAHPFNPDIVHLTELFWWVIPAFRGTNAGARLLVELEKFAREVAHGIVLSLEEKTIEAGMVDPASLVRRGYRPMERSYLLEFATEGV